MVNKSQYILWSLGVVTSGDKRWNLFDTLVTHLAGDQFVCLTCNTKFIPHQNPSYLKLDLARAMILSIKCS